MAYKQIPLTNSPNHSFVCSLTINDKSRTLRFFQRFSEIAGYWLIDIYDDTTDVCLIGSLPLVTGNYPAANLLAQYEYLQIGVACLINIAGTSEEYPSVDTIANDWALVWGDNL